MSVASMSKVVSISPRIALVQGSAPKMPILNHGMAGFHLQDLHAEALAGAVLLPHRIRAGACEVVGRKYGLDGHFGLRKSRIGTSLLYCGVSRLVMRPGRGAVNDCGAAASGPILTFKSTSKIGKV